MGKHLYFQSECFDNDANRTPALTQKNPRAKKKDQRVTKKAPGDSSRDLFIPDRWRSRFHPLKGSRELTIPKRSRLESPGIFCFHWSEIFGRKIWGQDCVAERHLLWQGRERLSCCFPLPNCDSRILQSPAVANAPEKKCCVGRVIVLKAQAAFGGKFSIFVDL